MIYLIAQYAVVFLLAGLFGFLLGRWWARRSYVDVTESYETISRAAADAPWDRVWSRFDGVDQTVRGIVREELAALPQPEIPKVDLGGIESQLRTLEQRVANLPQPSEVDLDPLSKSIQDVDARIAALPAPRTPEPVNLAPLDHRIAAVEQAVACGGVALAIGRFTSDQGGRGAGVLVLGAGACLLLVGATWDLVAAWRTSGGGAGSDAAGPSPALVGRIMHV